MITYHPPRERTNDSSCHESLLAIKKTIDMGLEHADYGWSRETARIFAIDTAMMTYRRNVTDLAELDRQVLLSRLNEARRLVADEREVELDSIQYEFETHLNHSAGAGVRIVWLTALNALLPDPYRAAVATVTAAITASPGHISEFAGVLRHQLRTRLEEHTDLDTSTVLAIA